MAETRFQEWLAKQTDDALLCRDTGIRHPWEPYSAVWHRSQVIETLVCKRCGSEKTRVLEKDGTLVRTNYRYAPEFTRKGMGRMTKSENARIRVAALKKRATGGDA